MLSGDLCQFKACSHKNPEAGGHARENIDVVMESSSPKCHHQRFPLQQQAAGDMLSARRECTHLLFDLGINACTWDFTLAQIFVCTYHTNFASRHLGHINWGCVWHNLASFALRL